VSVATLPRASVEVRPSVTMSHPPRSENPMPRTPTPLLRLCHSVNVDEETVVCVLRYARYR